MNIIDLKMKLKDVYKRQGREHPFGDGTKYQ